MGEVAVRRSHFGSQLFRGGVREVGQVGLSWLNSPFVQQNVPAVVADSIFVEGLGGVAADAFHIDLIAFDWFCKRFRVSVERLAVKVAIPGLRNTIPRIRMLSRSGDGSVVECAGPVIGDWLTWTTVPGQANFTIIAAAGGDCYLFGEEGEEWNLDLLACGDCETGAE